MKKNANSSQNNKNQIRKIKPGKQNGLTLWLDQHSDTTSFGTIYDDYNGFKVNIFFIRIMYHLTEDIQCY